uniref:hypothetical protein n=1 Tax=Streptomyces sp. NBC_01001 TaxID=2903713 RepID=UPI002F911AAF|nr:hypothetical protein OG296_36640 [Streptomyces sp. NBC_01001]
MTKAGLNEMLAGKRCTSREALLEFVRVLTTPGDLDPAAAAAFKTDPNLEDAWRGRWQEIKLLQRQAQPASKRVRAEYIEFLLAEVREALAIGPDTLERELDRRRAILAGGRELLQCGAPREASQLLEHSAGILGGLARHVCDYRRTSAFDGPPCGGRE